MNAPAEIPADNVADQERQRRARRRNMAVFIVLAAFVALVYAITIVKIKLGHGA